MTKCTDSGDLRQLSPRARWDTPSTFGTPQKKKSRVELCFMSCFFQFSLSFSRSLKYLRRRQARNMFAFYDYGRKLWWEIEHNKTRWNIIAYKDATMQVVRKPTKKIKMHRVVCERCERVGSSTIFNFII